MEQQHRAVNLINNLIYNSTCALLLSPDLDGSAYDHDGIVQRSLCLLCELFCSTPQDDGARLGLRTALEEIIPADIAVVRGHVQCTDVILWRRRTKDVTSYLSPPTWTSSKRSHCPRTSSVRAPTVVWMEPPQAWRSHYTQSVTFKLIVIEEIWSVAHMDSILTLMKLHSCRDQFIFLLEINSTHLFNIFFGLSK